MTWDDFQPYYDFGVMNSPVELYQGSGSIDYTAGDPFDVDLIVSLVLLPRPGLSISVTMDEIPKDVNSTTVETVRIQGKDIPVFAKNVRRSWPGPSEIQLCPRQSGHGGLGDQATLLSHGVFHLVNFREIYWAATSSETRGDRQIRIEHLVLSGGGWEIEIRSLFDTPDTVKQLEASGGCGLTHIARFRKSDQTPFPAQDAEELLFALRFFLTFAHGDWMSPVLPVGFGANDEPAWTLWNPPHDQRRKPQTWFDPYNCVQLQHLFPLFMAKWTDSTWNDTFREVIYWYTRCNDGLQGVDAGIILGQSAVERVAYQFLVHEQGAMQRDGYCKLPAADRMRLFLSIKGIPTAIPSSLTDLTNLAKSRNWTDGPQAIAEIRNSIVHPEHKSHGDFNEVYIDVWRLCLWYLEMSILTISGYNGTYGNRLIRRMLGTVEKVPWAK